MKRNLIYLFLIIFFVLGWAGSRAQAQDVDISGTGVSVPGVSCGMAGSKNGADKCCYVQYGDVKPPGTVESIINTVDPDGNYQKIKGQINAVKNIAQTPCLLGTPSAAISDPGCKCVLSVEPTGISQLEELCNKYLSGDENGRCINCAAAGAIWSGVGCIPLNVASFINDYVLRIGVGFAGFIALMCIIFAAFQMQTSQGAPDKVKKAQEMLTACISGLVLIVFSVFILRVIGVDILKLPF